MWLILALAMTVTVVAMMVKMTTTEIMQTRMTTMTRMAIKIIYDN